MAGLAPVSFLPATQPLHSMTTRKDDIVSVVLDALDRNSALLNTRTPLSGLRLDVKFNREGHPVKVILWAEAEYFVRLNP